ncbi:MAG: DUF819 family protein [Flavobacteriales bacterium]|nr:DUF819 family protein [Flavobacteriales bacterium]
MSSLIKNDVIVFGLLMLILGVIFSTSSSEKKGWKMFYGIIPPLFLCYFIPGILNSAGIISGSQSALPKMASSYLLPASLVLLTLSLDIQALRKLGGKALLIFFAGTLGVILGGPISLYLCKIIQPSAFQGVGAEEVWRGMAAIAGSWIGGGANQVAMRDIFGPSADLFSIMIAVDVIMANLLMAGLLFFASRNEGVNRFLKADTTALDLVKKRMQEIQISTSRIASVTDIMKMAAAAFFSVAVSHAAGNFLGPYFKTNWPELDRFSLSSSFFWVILTVSTLGILLSFTPLKKLEGAGASKIGTVLLYILVATIGMQMDITSIFNYPIYFLMGFIWILVHIAILLVFAKLSKSPFFFVAVGSQANIGGAASAPVVASAFDPSLASVGALLAVLGYAVGTYGAYLCALIMQAVY